MTDASMQYDINVHVPSDMDEEKMQAHVDRILREVERQRDDRRALANAEKLKRSYFDQLGEEIHETNVEKGFWGDPEMMDKYVAKLALIHSELTEVLEALRKSQGADKVTEEFADVLIRTFDLYAVLVEAGEADPELWGVMHDKMKTNAARAPKHGNRWG